MDGADDLYDGGDVDEDNDLFQDEEDEFTESVDGLNNDDILSDDGFSSSLESVEDVKQALQNQPRILMDVLTLYEKTRALGIRIRQLMLGSPPLVDPWVERQGQKKVAVCKRAGTERVGGAQVAFHYKTENSSWQVRILAYV